MALLGWLVAVIVAVVAAAVVLRTRSWRADSDRLEEVEQQLARSEGRIALLGSAEEQLRKALDAIPQGVVIGDGTGEVAYHNHAATNFIAARHGEALVEAAIRELLTDAVAGRSANRTLDLYGPPRRIVALTAAALPGSAAGGLIVVDDISERRALDSVRRDFVTNISHELKTPVSALGLLAETIQDEDDVVVSRRLAGRMVDEAFRVARTIDDLLELSRIEGGGRASDEDVPVDEVVNEAVDRIRPAAELRFIAIEVGPTPSHLTVRGDRRQLASALYNLLDNAVKYSDEGSVVEVQAGTATASDGTALVEVAVTDEGPGIPARDIDRIFERFYRVDRARSRNTGGTGLGLAIVRHVVANHEGEVVVRSQEGSGSTFTLRVPVRPGPVPEAEHDATTG